jgi:hypothetical protein
MPKIILLLLFIATFTFSSSAIVIHNDYKTLLSEKTKDNANVEEEPSSVIVRDRAAYEKLREKHKGLPAAGTINFKKFAVVAAYTWLPTPCHGLRFTKTGSDITVSIKSPPNDMMCMQVIANIAEIRLVPATSKEKLKTVFKR